MDDPVELTHDRPSRPASSPVGGLELRHVGVLAALPGELGPFLAGSSRSAPSEGHRPEQQLARSALGVAVHSPTLPGDPFEVSCAVSGVGKVAAAHAASALLACGAEALFVVGTCGGLSPDQVVGEFVHLRGAMQWDLSTREGREVVAHPGLTDAWQRATGGGFGWTLTADRPAIRWASRWRRARAAGAWMAQSRSDDVGAAGSSGPGNGALIAVADMETAAVGAVADRAGIPWAGMRVISDAQRSVGARLLRRKRGDSSFAANYKAQAARPAATLWDWLSG